MNVSVATDIIMGGLNRDPQGDFCYDLILLNQARNVIIGAGLKNLAQTADTIIHTRKDLMKATKTRQKHLGKEPKKR